MRSDAAPGETDAKAAPTRRASCLLVLASIALAAGSAWLLAAWIWGPTAVRSALLGAAVAGAGGLVALPALLRMHGRPPDEAGLLALAAMGLRLFGTMAGVLIVLLTKSAETIPFALGIVLGYLSLLAVEVFVAMRALGQNPGAGKAQAASSGTRPRHPAGEQATGDGLSTDE